VLFFFIGPETRAITSQNEVALLAG
jgi:hypothetical protein